MAKQFEVKSIEYNQKMANKYAGAFLHTIAVESETKRRDFVFENSKQFKVLQECAVGNIVELKIVKNGDFFNLAKEDDAIILVSKEKKEEAPPTDNEHVKEGCEKFIPPVKEYSKYKEDPDKQAAIIRQNALTNATTLIIASGLGDNVDKSVKYIIATAMMFAKYSSGEDMTEYLAEELVSFDDVKRQISKDSTAEIKRGRKAKETTSDGPIPEYVGEFGE